MSIDPLHRSVSMLIYPVVAEPFCLIVGSSAIGAPKIFADLTFHDSTLLGNSFVIPPENLMYRCLHLSLNQE